MKTVAPDLSFMNTDLPTILTSASSHEEIASSPKYL